MAPESMSANIQPRFVKPYVSVQKHFQFQISKPIKLANIHFDYNKLQKVMSCNCNWSHVVIGKYYNIEYIITTVEVLDRRARW